MREDGNKFQIRRKPVGVLQKHSSDGEYESLEPEEASINITTAQVRDASNLDILAATYNTETNLSYLKSINSSPARRFDDNRPEYAAHKLLLPLPMASSHSPRQEGSFEERESTAGRVISTDAASTASVPSEKATDNAGSLFQGQTPDGQGQVSRYFSRTFLVGLATTFVVMILALEILNMLSERNRGLVAVDERNHHLWTYGPTFVLTLFVALFGQFEHRAKHLMPWLAMAKGPAEAEHGFLLDYITPLTVESLFQSAKRKHFLVTLSILGTLVLRALVIVSTGLLSVSRMTMVRDVNVTTLDQFNMSRVLSRFAVDNSVTMWGLIQNQLPYPVGTTEQVVAQTFTSPEQGETLTAPVDVFEVDLVNCTAFSWDFLPKDKYYTGSGLVSLSAAERELLQPYCVLYQGEAKPILGKLFSVSFSSVHQAFLCPNETKVEEDHYRLVAGMKFSKTKTTKSFSGLMCRPVYSLTRRKVTTPSVPREPGKIMSVDSEVLEHLALGVPPTNITSVILDSFGSGVRRLVPYQKELPNLKIWHRLMNYTDPQPDWADVGDMSRFPGVFKSVYKAASLQAIKSREMELANVTRTGEISYRTNRLVVEKVPLRVMESLLVVLAIISLSFCFFPYGSLPTRSGFMLTLATILSRSPQLGRILGGTGSLGKYPFKKRLSSFLFHLIAGDKPSDVRVEVQAKTGRTFRRTRGGIKAAQATDCWTPLAASPAYKAVLIVLTISVIAALEILLQHSIRNNGIATVSTEGYAKYSWLFLPGIIMASFALAYSTVDVTYRLLHPFQQLNQAKEPNLLALKYDPLGKLTLTAVVHALKSRYVPLAAAMFTSLLGPVLTIAASGLFSPVLEPGRQTVSVQMNGWFNVSSAINNQQMYFDFQAAAVDTVFSQAIIFNNMTYPQGTYEGLAFPEMQVPAASEPKGDVGANTNQTSTLLLRLPAARGQMNCSLQLSATNQNFPEIYNTRRYVIAVEPPQGCSAPPSPYTDISPDRSKIWIHKGFPSNGTWARGMRSRWSLPEGWSGLNDTFLSDEWDPFRICNDERQHLWFAYGKQSGNHTDYVRVLHCTPYLETVSVDATFTLPDLETRQDVEKRPRTLDATAAPWSGNNKHYSVAYPYLLKSATERPNLNMDDFYEALSSGKDAVPFDELTDPANVDLMIEKMNNLYQVLVAQALNRNYRSSAAERSTISDGFAPIVNGTIVDGSRLRLMQSPISTRILEGIFFLMLLCACAVFFLSGPTKILPKNPGSIASRMSLLADSTILNYMTDHRLSSSSVSSFQGYKEPVVHETELGQQELFAEDVFSLGWWHTEKGKSRYGVDLGMADNQPDNKI